MLQVLALAAAAEATTQHPVASALMAAARERGVPVTPGLGATTVPGKGVVATVNGERVAVGRLEWALEQVG